MRHLEKKYKFDQNELSMPAKSGLKTPPNFNNLAPLSEMLDARPRPGKGTKLPPIQTKLQPTPRVKSPINNTQMKINSLMEFIVTPDFKEQAAEEIIKQNGLQVDVQEEETLLHLNSSDIEEEQPSKSKKQSLS